MESDLRAGLVLGQSNSVVSVCVALLLLALFAWVLGVVFPWCLAYFISFVMDGGSFSVSAFTVSFDWVLGSGV